MKKRILSLILAIVTVLATVPFAVTAGMDEYPIPDYGPQARETAREKYERGEVLSVAHRAAWRHGPENSLISIAAAIEIGVDVVELDVALTQDNVLVLFHDSTINRTVWREKGDVSDYTWDELSGMYLEAGQGGSDKAYRLTEWDVQVLNSLSDYAIHSGSAAEVGGTMPPTRMDDAIELIDRRVMINLDKCTTEELFVACYILFRETDMLDHVFFKNSVSATTLATWCESAAAAWSEKYPDEPLTMEQVRDSFIYVYVKSSSGTSALQAHLNAGSPLKMVELVIGNATVEKAYKAVDEVWCRENGIAMFVNTMWSGLADTRPDSEVAWAEMIDRGYTAIQTDRPSELVEYLREAHLSDRPSADTIEAEHFSDFSYDEGYSLTVPVAGDKALNKTVSDIRHGEWLAYDNIVFDGSEISVTLKGDDVHPLTHVLVYIDEMSDVGLVADVQLADVTTAALDRAVAPGKHTVYLRAVGAPNTDLATLDSFSFSSSEESDGFVTEPMFILTSPGVAPTLPAAVTFTDGTQTCELPVKWERIPAEDYAAEGYFPVLGYVYALRDYVFAMVVVTAQQTKPYYGDIAVNYSDSTDPIVSDGLVLWLDGSEGLTHSDGRVTAWTNKANGTQSATVKGTAPAYVGNAANGKAGVDFDGGSALQITLDSDVFNGLDGLTVIAYVNTRTPYLTDHETSNGAAWRAQRRTLIYAGENGGSWGSVFMGVYTDYLSARVGTGTVNDNGYYKSYEGSGGFSTTAVVWDGTNKTYSLSLDGETAGSASSLGSASKNNSNVLYIGEGKDAGTLGGWDGTLTELIVYDRALSATELDGITDYLNAKYVSDVPPVYVSGVSLEEENTHVTVSVGEEYVLNGSTVPADADNTALIWQSSDPSIVSVDGNGRVKANSTGLAIITVTTEEGRYSASCAIRVSETYGESLYEDIVNMVSWARSRDSALYDGWDDMTDAVAAAEVLTPDNSIEGLEAAYKGLREAMLSLTLKGHTHNLAVSFTVTAATHDEKGMKLLACTDCMHFEEREIPQRVQLSFTDVDGDDWFYGAVEYVVSEGMMNGVASGKFGPNGTLTRAMVVTVLYRAVGSPAVTGAPNFTDVKTGQWYTDAIAWAQANGVVNGVTATTFAPDAPVTREQIAAILWRYSNSPETDADLGVFTDGDKVSAYARDAILWAVSEGIFAGSNGALLPRDNATRAQFATIIMRFFG